MGTRRRAREAALKILYRMDITGEWDADRCAEEYFRENPGAEKEEQEFGLELAHGVAGRLGEIDALLGACLTNWPVDRLGYMERAILRTGIFEIMWQDFTPDKVAVDEAVEMAKAYCDKESPKLINAALQKVMDGKAAGGGPGAPEKKLAV